MEEFIYDNAYNFSMRNSPQLGLFWFDKSKTKIILHRYSDAKNELTKDEWLELLKSAKGSPNKNLISVTPRHRELWSKLKEKSLLKKLKLPDEFNTLPRGRIMKDLTTSKFIIYYGNWLNEKTLKLILDKFHLSINDIDLRYGYNPTHYSYEGSEYDLDSIRHFMYKLGIWDDTEY